MIIVIIQNKLFSLNALEATVGVAVAVAFDGDVGESDDETFDGEPVGELVGELVGEPDGDPVGESEGVAVGVLVAHGSTSTACSTATPFIIVRSHKPSILVKLPV